MGYSPTLNLLFMMKCVHVIVCILYCSCMQVHDEVYVYVHACVCHHHKLWGKKTVLLVPVPPF